MTPRRRGLSISTKLVLLNGLGFGLLAIAVFAFVPGLIERRLLASRRDDCSYLGAVLAANLKASMAFDDAQSANELVASAKGDSDLLFVTVKRADGSILAHYRRQGTVESPELSTPAGWAFSGDGERLEVVTAIELEGRLGGSIRIGESMESARVEVRLARGQLAILSVILFLVGTIAAYAISAYVVRPLRDLSATAERVAAGDLTTRSTVTSSDEVGLLAAIFDRMVSSLASAQKDLESANRGLEDRVAARTRELEVEIAQRRRAEEAHSESERRYRSLFDENLSGSFLCRPDGTILACNPAFARIFGFASPDVALREPSSASSQGTRRRGASSGT